MRPARRSFLAAAAAALVGAVAVGQADGQVSANILSVACEGQTATLSMQDNEATYTCENGSNGNKMMVADFEVHVQASEVTLNLQNDYTLRTLNITGGNGTPTINSAESLNLAVLHELHRLRFESVKFVADTVLTLPTDMSDLHITVSSMTDLSLANYPTNFTVINLTDTSFDQIPKVLYERQYESNMDISGPGEDISAGDSSGGISTGVLVVIIVLVVVIAVVLAFFILRMYFKRKAANSNAHNNEATTTLMSKSDATADKGSFISNDEFLRNFRLPQSDVSLVKSVGTGRLWVGEYNGGKVMVKRVESEVTDSYVTKALMAQARTFATISHPNITSLVGVTWLAGTDFAVVTEFMDKNNLKTVLSNTDVDLDVSTKLQMCCDVALALAYLHETEQNMCAKQLSSRKVLVNNAMGCKLSLFECVPSSAKLGGPSKVAAYSYGMGEVAWLAPEVLTRSSPMDARKNNIFAFGILVSEIFTRVSPYQSLVEEKGNTMSDVELVARVRRQEPLVPHENRQEYLDTPASVRQLVEQCLSYAPMSRPTAKDLVEVLHNAKEELVTNSI
ncbi:hypothetical protein PHYSODRAFT_251756 [Phytophthora sojae]|uniref:Protein kinase domain-containing protein n=1 Tax=Phytophthora sojae (strain P6497) TaxID=1094619 RepID=G4YZG0_PHYSP|nr:hypothetical protein PHYSODRAFT_251756 [Phytophthora sojae]EGZ25166.1 hypothetical protein PHYSODRAFT_251756 [Phytophthora sojae]|eukprot:XP_009520454.1 hypothetical protein PHYSODRAFT_251756 [Phytophthora sojae]